MPRTYAPRRTQIAVRLSPGGLAHIDLRATEAEVTRVEMIRRMLAYATQHMPRDTPLLAEAVARRTKGKRL